MKINDIAFLNFRRFAGMHRIYLHPSLTVFAANNGAGKTSVLDAISLAFGAFLTRLPKISGNNLRDSDVSMQADPDEPYLILMANAELGPENSAQWSRLRAAPGKTQKSSIAKRLAEEQVPEGLKEINVFADFLSQNENSNVVFPVLAYYGTGRAILDIPQRRRGFGKEFPRFQAYAGCLNPRTNFKRLFEYFYFLEDLERREKEEARDWNYANGQLQAIRNAIKSFLPEFERPRTELKPLRFMVDNKNNGLAYDIEMLSDGYKTSLAMVMDIAMRMVEANPHFGEDALTVPGIILIDEIELHLHPSWQQRIIPDLQRTFPNVQFICTTHSPQVLSTVPTESIRTIGEDGRIAEPNCKTYGAESKRVLEELMGVSSRPPVHEKELREFIRITDAGDWTSARYQELRAILVRDLGETDPVIIEADIKKNFQELEVE